MKFREIPKGTAVVVDLVELSNAKPNDSVLLGIRGWIDDNGKFVPFDEKLQMFREELNNSIGENAALLKRKS